MPRSEYDRPVTRASTTSDVFNAIADMHRREVLGAMLETCGSAGKGMKEGAPSRMIES